MIAFINILTSKKITLRFSFYRNQWVFSPNLLVIAITFLACSGFIKLGLWQVQRSKEKQSLINSYQRNIKKTPLPFEQLKKTAFSFLTEEEKKTCVDKDPFDGACSNSRSLMTFFATIRYLPVEIRGYYDARHNFLHDNKFHQHILGYDVITPFYANGEKFVIFVNRGWIAKDNLSILSTPTGQQTLTGYIDIPPEHSFRLSRQLNDPNAWPKIIEALELKELGQLLNKSTSLFLIKSSEIDPNGFVREWSTVTTMPPERHQAYAFQWFALSFTILILFFVLNFERTQT